MKNLITTIVLISLATFTTACQPEVESVTEGWTEVPCVLSEVDSYETPIEDVTEHSYTYSNRAIYRAHVPSTLIKRCLPGEDCPVIDSETLTPVCGERWEEMLCEITEDDFYCVVTEIRNPIPMTPVSAWVTVTE